MKVEQIYTNCLAEAAYYIESEGEAAIIDPLREVDQYIQMAKDDNASIKYIFETHFHADFVSGHVDLARKTGATIVFGPTAKTNFDAMVAEDNQIIEIGKAKIKVLHTPGHTMESVTYLLIDENGKETAIFTGDTLFLGDVGRPDLAVKSDLSSEDLAGMLYDSLRNKIMPLADDVTVYPGHGAGSACGKNMSSETVGTLGEQKKTNYALRADMTKQEFIDELLDGILPPPQYFPKNVAKNKSVLTSVDDVLEQGANALSVEEFKNLAAGDDVLILDTRTPDEFCNGFIPGSTFIGIDGSFASWVGTLISDINQKMLLITPEGREEEVITRLARVGYDHAIGFLKGGVSAWIDAGEAVEKIPSVSIPEFEDIINKEEITVLDVRKVPEYQSEHVEGAINLPLAEVSTHAGQIDKEKEHYVHCAGGYRSVIYCSILRQNGYDKLVNVEKGFGGIKNTSIPKTEYVCPTTL